MQLVDKLLEQSIGQHGFWLKNHKNIIIGELTEALEKFGFLPTTQLLNKIDSPFVVNLYKKIEENR